jgi:rubrerythrin
MSFSSHVGNVPLDSNDYPNLKKRLEAALVTENAAVQMYTSILADLKKDFPSLRITATKIAEILKDEKDHQKILIERIAYLTKYRNAI